MDDVPPSVGEAMAAALAKALIRKEVLDEADIAAAAADLDQQGGETNEAAAHILRCTVIEAFETPQSEWAAERARKRFRVVESGE